MGNEEREELEKKIEQEMMVRFGEMMQERMVTEQRQKAANFRTLNRLVKKGGILFTGSSLMEMFSVSEMAVSAGIRTPVYNRGIGGTTTEDFLREIDAVLLGVQPKAVFINIGTNDMTDRVYGSAWMEHLLSNYEAIIRTGTEKLPGTVFYCMAYYPTNQHLPGQEIWAKEMLKERTKENIRLCCEGVERIAKKYGQRYIDVNEGLYDENGEQKKEFAIDGVHMIAEAYAIVFQNLLPYLRELDEQ